jgi:hypothetical protein
MMISKEYSLIRYDGNGNTVVFAYDFDTIQRFGDSQVKVLLKDKPLGTLKTLVQGIDYTLFFAGKTVTITPAPSENNQIIIARSLPYIQDYNFANLGLSQKETIEMAVDYRALCEQQIKDGVPDLLKGFDRLTVNQDLADGQKYLNEKIEVEREDRIDDVTSLYELYNRFKDGFTIIGSYDFGTDSPTQEELTAKANEFKSGADINIGDTILNLNDERRWYWNSQIVQWIDFGVYVDISTQYPDGTDPRTIKKEGFFYINNATSGSSYSLPAGVGNQNRCFGFCHKGREQYYGYDIYYIQAIFFNVGPGVGAIAIVNTSGYWTVVCDDILYLNRGWQEIAPQIYKDYYKKNLFTRIGGSRTGLVPNPTYSGTDENNKPVIKFSFSGEGTVLFTKTSDGYLKKTISQDYTIAIDINFNGNMYLMVPYSGYVYGLPTNIYTSYKIIDDFFADVPPSEFEAFDLVYSTIEDRFCITDYMTSVWSNIFIGYLGKFNITMDDPSGTNYAVEVLRQGKAGLSLWPVDLGQD